MKASNVVSNKAVALAAAIAMSCVCRSGFAQDLEDDPDLSDDEAAAQASPEPPPEPPPEPEPEPEPEQAETVSEADDGAAEAAPPVVQSDTNTTAAESPRAVASPPDPEQKNGFVKPASDNVLSWSGSLETDTGYATYTFDSAALHDEEVYDFRGRFVFGPTVEHRFWGDWFFRARGEAVMWIREQFGVYQVNVDDAFAQVGNDVWDFKLGRFRTWRVYHRGLGFDLFTLEDTGACVQNPCSAEAGTFGPDMYEVSFNYDRETPGRAALHVYPTAWSGIELAAVYGQAGVSNQIGVRAAAMVHFDFLRVMGAAELRQSRPREEASSTDGMGNTTECERCGVSQRAGYGGGVELTLPPFEAGLNAALGATDIYTVTSGAFDEGASNDTRTFGGYAELDVGTVVFDQALIMGFGLNKTEALAVNENFREHLQYAAYLAYPLGFNGALVKLVLSRSDLTSLTLVDPMSRVFNESTSAMSSARLRIAYPF